MTAKLEPGAPGNRSIAVKLYIVDESDPNALPIAHEYRCSLELFRHLVDGPVRSSQIFARMAVTGSAFSGAKWRQANLAFRFSRPGEALQAAPAERLNDYRGPIAEFEQPRLRAPRLLAENDLGAEHGLLYWRVPAVEATLGASDAAFEHIRDLKMRSAVRLSWQSRPASLCDASLAEPDLIGGFDLFTSSRDREPPADRDATPEQLARLARPLGRVQVKPATLLNSEPAAIEDFSKLDVAYPSATRLNAKVGWLTSGSSRLVWPQFTTRRALMLVPDEAIIGELVANGVPSDIVFRFSIDAVYPDDPEPRRYYQPLELRGVLGAELPVSLSRLAEYTYKLEGSDLGPRMVRIALQHLMLHPEVDIPPAAFGRLEITWMAQGRAHGPITLDIGLSSVRHPILDDVLDFLRYEPKAFTTGSGYRRYEPVLEGATVPIAGVPNPDKAAPDPKPATKPVLAQFLSDTNAELDRGGWKALRQLGLAVGLRLWDTQTSDWVSPDEEPEHFLWAWRAALDRKPVNGEVGAPFFEQIFDPEEIFTLGGEDEIPRSPRIVPPRGLPLVQFSLRPIAERLALWNPADWVSMHFLTVTTRQAGRITAAGLAAEFGKQGAHLEICELDEDERPGARIWVGEGLDAADFEPVAQYDFAAGQTVLVRLVLALTRLTPKNAKDELRAAIESSEPAIVDAVDWDPLARSASLDTVREDLAVPRGPDPYLLFGALPAGLKAHVETGQTDGQRRFLDLASSRFVVPDRVSADVIQALESWEQRFFVHGPGSDRFKPRRRDFDHDVGFAVGTFDAPASLRRAPDEDGNISVLYLDESRLGSWRRFYVRPFGRFDHLAEASGWLSSRPDILDAQDFGLAPALHRHPEQAAAALAAARPWVDVALARTRPIAKPVLLAAAHSTEANALIVIAARPDEAVLADANQPQAGARQIGALDIGWEHGLDAANDAWASRLLGHPVPLQFAASPPAPVDPEPLVGWITGHATPPAPQDPDPDPALPDVWRGALAVAAYDLPYFFDYAALLAANAGTQVSSATRAPLPSPPPRPVWSLPDHASAQWNQDRLSVTLPLVRFRDCMDDDSVETWYDPQSAGADLFDVPDPAIIYRFQQRSPDRDIVASVFDVEADSGAGTYRLRTVGQSFVHDGTPVEPVCKGSDWTITFELRVAAGLPGPAPWLEVVPVRHRAKMAPVPVGKWIR